MDKARCQDLATMGGDPSYVDLLTCLELATRDEGPTGAWRRGPSQAPGPQVCALHASFLWSHLRGRSLSLVSPRANRRAYTANGKVSGTSSASHCAVVSSGSSACVSSKWSTASNWSGRQAVK